MSTLSEKNYIGDLVKYEQGLEVRYARDAGTLITGQNLAIGAVLGKIALGAVTSAAKSGGNTGNGTLVPDVTTPTLASAQLGIYLVRCTVASTNAATFRVTDPKGNVIGDVSFSGSGASGTFSDQIKFAVTDGGTDFIVGDGFDVTVAAGSGKYTALAPTALDGSQYVAGVLLGSADATSADVAILVLSRASLLSATKLVWPAGISAGNKATAIVQLAALGIILRTGA